MAGYLAARGIPWDPAWFLASWSEFESLVILAERSTWRGRRLRGRGAAGCVVLGEPGDYARLGFVAEPSMVLPGVPPEYFQAIAFSRPLPAGEVSYHASFAARV